jgi:hypothetical protein
MNDRRIPEKEMKNKKIVFAFASGIAITVLFNLMHRHLKGLGISAGDWLNFSVAMLGVVVSVVSLWDKVPFLSQDQIVPVPDKDLPVQLPDDKVNSKLDKIKTISEGLAVGYFYNFLHDIRALVNDEIKVQFEDRQQTFLPDQVEIQLVIPKRLSNASIKHAGDSISRKQADIISTVGRNLKINYAFEDEGAKLIIKDLVKPCSAMKEYMQDYLLLHEDTQEWHSSEEEALKKFRETIDSLCMSVKNFDKNKVIWRPID